MNTHGESINTSGRLATLGELDGRLAFYFDGGGHRSATGRPSSIDSLFVVMARSGIRALHVHRSALPLMGLPSELPPTNPGARRPPHPFMACKLDIDHRALSPAVSSPGIGEITFGAYREAGDPFGEARDAAELLRAHQEFTGALGGWEYRHSAMSTGWKLMHQRRRGRQLDLSDASHPAELEGVQVEQAYGAKWARSQLDGARMPYVVAWDVNAQRLAACSRLSLGIAGLQERRGLPFDKRLPGYHLVKSIDTPYAGRIPPIFEPGWHTTPRVAMAEYLGLRFDIERSWVWTEHSPYLNPWYERLRDARAALLPRARSCRGAAIALEVLKQAYLEPLGRLRSPRLRGFDQYRPHWYDSVIGQELGRQYLKMHELVTAGVQVLAVYFDTVIIESDHEQPTAEACAGVLDISDQAGKWKPVGSMDAQAARAVLYAGAEPDVGLLVKALKMRGYAAAQPVRAGRSAPNGGAAPASPGSNGAGAVADAPAPSPQTLVRLGPPSAGNVIHRASCRYAKAPNAIHWPYTLGHVDGPWLRPCGHCKPELVGDAG